MLFVQFDNCSVCCSITPVTWQLCHGDPTTLTVAAGDTAQSFLVAGLLLLCTKMPFVRCNQYPGDRASRAVMFPWSCHTECAALEPGAAPCAQGDQ